MRGEEVSLHDASLGRARTVPGASHVCRTAYGVIWPCVAHACTVSTPVLPASARPVLARPDSRAVRVRAVRLHDVRLRAVRLRAAPASPAAFVVRAFAARAFVVRRVRRWGAFPYRYPPFPQKRVARRFGDVPDESLDEPRPNPTVE